MDSIMNNIDQTRQDRFHRLMMAALDGELGPQEQSELNELKKNPDFLREYNELSKIKEVTFTMKFKNPAPEVWDKYWLNVYNKIERGIGLVLFSIGFFIIIFIVIQQALADTNVPTIVKVAILCLFGGLIILLVSVLRERIFVRKHDRYKEIIR